MEKSKNVILSSIDNDTEIEFNIEDANNLDYIKSMIRDGIVQVKMPIKVKCNHDDLLLLNKYLYLKRDKSQVEKYEQFHNDLFSVENDFKMRRFFSLFKSIFYS